MISNSRPLLYLLPFAVVTAFLTLEACTIIQARERELSQRVQSAVRVGQTAAEVFLVTEKSASSLDSPFGLRPLYSLNARCDRRGWSIIPIPQRDGSAQFEVRRYSVSEDSQVAWSESLWTRAEVTDFLADATQGCQAMDVAIGNGGVRITLDDAGKAHTIETRTPPTPTNK